MFLFSSKCYLVKGYFMFKSVSVTNTVGRFAPAPRKTPRNGIIPPPRKPQGNKTQQMTKEAFEKMIKAIEAKSPKDRTIAEQIQLASYKTAQMLLAMPKVVMAK